MSHRYRRAGAILLAVGILAATGLPSPAAALELSQPAPAQPALPSPATAPSQPAPPSPTATPAPATTPATTAPAPAAAAGKATPAKTPSAPAPGSTTQAAAQAAQAAPQPGGTKDPAAMAAAIGPGGAEMGQRSARVSAPSPLLKASTQSAALETLTTQGTWSPSFGVKGLDVSGHQTSVNWQSQWNMGARFAYVKASEGNYFINDSFGAQYAGAGSVGMIRGAYHFAIPNWSSGADQARFFVNNGGGWSADGKTMPPVLDFEFNPYAGRTINGFYFGNTCYGMSPAQLTSWVRDFGNTMRALTGRLPVIYTNTLWWNQCTANAPGFGDYPLWVASYPLSATDIAGAVPSSWSVYSMWQYSSTGPFTGDSNIWNGDYPSLQRFAGTPLPTGSFDDLSMTRDGAAVYLRARGWSADLSNVASSIQTHIYVTDPSGKTTGYPWLANKSRPDVDQALGYGASHGFDGTVRITASGTYKVCAYAIGAFGNTLLDCKSLRATGVEAPTGSFDSFGQVRTADQVTLQLKGWAADLANTAASTYADAYITDPAGKTTGYRMSANVARKDVADATGLGLAHGFDYQVKATVPGTYRACVYSIGQNSNVQLSCKSVNVDVNPAPFGSYDSLSLRQAPNSANFQVSGWALDPVQPWKSVPVHVYVQSPDGSNPGYAYTANLKRPDVNAALFTVGDHGFQMSVPLTRAGRYSVCAYAIGVAPVTAGNTLLGCKSIDADPTPATMGFLDSASIQVSGGKASIIASGWTLDPSFPAESIPDHIYVTSPDGIRKGYAFTADLKRADVNRALDTVGDHGFTSAVPITQRGQYRVCAYGVAVSALSLNNSLLGCQSLTY
ncbi:lysozyme [Arthrobacter sp. 2MCAF15]|uniref:lysozyme n=1 Tax=Arthrobacter sp. 2MCAF15 TaxID=3232984 RepID=UPI003F905505